MFNGDSVFKGTFREAMTYVGRHKPVLFKLSLLTILVSFLALIPFVFVTSRAGWPLPLALGLAADLVLAYIWGFYSVFWMGHALGRLKDDPLLAIRSWKFHKYVVLYAVLRIASVFAAGMLGSDGIVLFVVFLLGSFFLYHTAFVVSACFMGEKYGPLFKRMSRYFFSWFWRMLVASIVLGLIFCAIILLFLLFNKFIHTYILLILMLILIIPGTFIFTAVLDVFSAKCFEAALRKETSV